MDGLYVGDNIADPEPAPDLWNEQTTTLRHSVQVQTMFKPPLTLV